MKVCAKCGTRVADQTAFCPTCATPFPVDDSILRMTEPPKADTFAAAATFVRPAVSAGEPYPLRPQAVEPPQPTAPVPSAPTAQQAPFAPPPVYGVPYCCSCPCRSYGQPSRYQQPVPQQTQFASAPTGKTASILSLVFGILSLLNVLIDPLSSAFAVAAIALGIVGLVRYGKRERLSGLALTGLLLAIAALLLQPFFPTFEEILVDIPYFTYPGEVVTPCKMTML